MPSASPSHNPFLDIRANFSQLLAAPSKVSPTSSTSHLGKRQQFLLALDGPGVPTDPFAYPLTWSGNGTNSIAVACKKDIYFQDLDTRIITHLCKLKKPRHGRPTTIQWCFDEPTHLGLGTTTGTIQVWDAMKKQIVQEWKDVDEDAVGGMSWNRGLLSVGVESGGIGFYDTREQKTVGRLTMHKSKVYGCKWSHDGNYLASSDSRGIVYVWDARAGKVLTNDDRMGGRMKHDAPVKVGLSPLNCSALVNPLLQALAWCPWKPDLLATGSTFPDGKIRIFSIKTTSSIPQPQSITPLHTSITSLQWSPHCKELLSTHGTSWHPMSSKSTTRPIQAKSPLMNSITVHTYPSLRRVVSVTAHAGAVGHSCLSPDGTMVFTVCPVEEAMKMWKIWGIQESKEKKESVFDKFGIR